MKSKIISLILCLTALVFCIPFSAFAADDNALAGVTVNKPKVTFELRASEVSAEDISDVYFNNESLVVDNVIKYNIDSSKTCCCVVVDISGSIPQKSIDAIKDSLYSYYEGFNEDDRFVLYTVGEETKQLLDGSEDADDVKQKIDSIKVSDDNSNIYNSLSKLYDDTRNDASYDRKQVFVITDGVNWSNETSFTKVNGKYSSRALPIYSLILDSGKLSKSSNALLSEFKELSEDSGGAYSMCSANNAAAKFNELAGVMNESYAVCCTAPSNRIDKANNNVLLFKFRGNEYKTVVDAANYVPDNTPPSVTDIVYNKNSREFEIQFSENILYDAEEIKNFVKVYKSDKEIAISSSRYSSETNTLYLLTDDMQYSGEYVFDLDGITDNSNEENPLASSRFEQKIKATSPFIKFVKSTWWIFVIIIFIVALVLILVFLKKKKHVKRVKELFETQVEEEHIEIKHSEVVKEKHYINSAVKTKKLTLYIESGTRKEKVNVTVESSAIIGRSGSCDVCINDAKMSRQHFAIELLNDRFSILNLSSTNGTYLNGNKLAAKQPLRNGDKILAGASLITIRF